MSRQTRIDEWGDRKLWWEWESPGDEPVARWEEVVYDPRTRPWYTQAVEPSARRLAPGAELWTDPYFFFSTGEPGITASLSFASRNSIDHVVAFDVELADLSAFTRSLRVHGRLGL